MRSRILTTLTSLTLVAGASALFIGCGGDDKPVNNDIPFNQEPAYQAVTAQANALVAGALEMAKDGYESTIIEGTDDLVYSPGGPSRVDSTVNQNYWQIIFSTNLSSGVNNFTVDSLQFRQDEVILPSHQNADAVELRHFSQQTASDTTVTYTTYTTNGQVDISGLDTDNSTVAGTVSMLSTQKYVSLDSTSVWTFDIDVTMSNLQVGRGDGDWSYGCPTSGSITVTINSTYQSSFSALASATYSYTLTFADGEATVAVTRGSESASYTNQFCTVQ